MKTITWQFEGGQTHGPLAANIALGFTMLSPLLILIIAFVGASLFGQPTG